MQSTSITTLIPRPSVRVKSFQISTAIATLKFLPPSSNLWQSFAKFVRVECDFNFNEKLHIFISYAGPDRQTDYKGCSLVARLQSLCCRHIMDGVYDRESFREITAPPPKKEHILFLSLHSLEVMTVHWMDLHAYLFCCSKLKKWGDFAVSAFSV